jgi:hypothetical protein
MGCKGGSQGVMAKIALEKISDEVRKIISTIEKDFEVSVEDINPINEKLQKISTENKKNS